MKYLQISKGKNKSRGQAFDTFKLMIAAVVAVAILGILMGILGSINIIGTGFDDAVRDLLPKANRAPGSVFPSGTEVSFTKDAIFTGASYKSLLGGTVPVYIECKGTAASSQLCKASGTDGVTISANFKQKIYAKCKADNSKCCVGISSAPTGCS